MSRYHARLSSRRWEQIRKQVFTRDQYRCTRCKKYGRLAAHHIIELHKGGAEFDLDNLTTLCSTCHGEIHKKPDAPGEAAWRALVSELRNS